MVASINKKDESQRAAFMSRRFRFIKDVIPLALVGAIVTAVWILGRWFYPLAPAWSWVKWLHREAYGPWFAVLKDMALSPMFYAAMFFIFIFEWRYPAKPKQKLFSVGFG